MRGAEEVPPKDRPRRGLGVPSQLRSPLSVATGFVRGAGGYGERPFDPEQTRTLGGGVDDFAHGAGYFGGLLARGNVQGMSALEGQGVRQTVFDLLGDHDIEADVGPTEAPDFPRAAEIERRAREMHARLEPWLYQAGAGQRVNRRMQAIYELTHRGDAAGAGKLAGPLEQLFRGVMQRLLF